MRNLVLLCSAIVCALVAASEPAYTTPGDTPTVGGDPAFATPTDVKLSTIRSLLEAKDYSAALRLAEEVAEESPDVVDGWMMLGYTRSLNGQYVESNKAYDRALGQGADSKEVLTRKAYNCRRLGDAQATRQCYQALLEEDEDNLEILMQYGAFEVTLENNEAAVKSFTRVARIQPGHIGAIQALAKVEEKRGNVAQVKYWLEQGLSHRPDDAALLKRLSLVYLNEQSYTLAVHYLKKLLEVDPTNTAGYRNLGIAYYQQREMRDATQAFEKVSELGGDLSGLYGPLADCYRQTGRRDKALETIKRGLEDGEQKAWLFSVWGKLLEDQKRYDLAIEKFGKAVALRDEPWSGYARKQIARQTQLKKRQAMIAAQGATE